MELHTQLFKKLAESKPQNNKQIEEVFQNVFIAVDEEYLDLAQASREHFAHRKSNFV